METHQIFIKGPSQQLVGRKVLTSRTFYDNRKHESLVAHPEMTEEAFSQFEAFDLPEGVHQVILVEVAVIEGKIASVLGFQEQTLARKG